LQINCRLVTRHIYVNNDTYLNYDNNDIYVTDDEYFNKDEYDLIPFIIFFCGRAIF